MRAVVNAAVIGGVSADTLLDAVGLEASCLDDVDTRVPYLKLAAIYDAAARLAGDPDFGIHAAQRIPEGGFGLLEYVASSSPTLGEAYLRITQYFRLLVDGVDVKLERRGSEARFIHRFPPGLPPPPRHSQEFVIGCILHYGRVFSGVDWSPRRVAFPHQEPGDTSAHQELFRCPVIFSHPSAELVFDPAILEAPMVKSDPNLLAILDRHAQDLLEQLPDEETTANRVRVTLSERLRGTAPSVEDVARQLGMSARTLQRRLKAEDTSHQQLLDEMRHELSLRYLGDDNMAISEVAFLLGFSEASAFHRAFRRWTGATPAEYRRRAA